MIRLTLNPQTNPEIHLFSKVSVVIGSDTNTADLVLNDKKIKPQHVTIIEQGDQFIISNEHNDPFVVINDQPFGKKILNDNDTIEIHDNTIAFENLNELAQNELPTPDPSPLAVSLSPLIPPLPFENEVEAFKENEFENEQLDLYIRDLEAQAQVPPPQLVKKEPKAKKSGSLKDDYLKDLDDDNPNNGAIFETEDSNHLIQAWKSIFLFLVTVFCFAAMVGTIIYFTISDKTEDQETKVAQGVADIAIALTHAKLSQPVTHNKSWADAEFIKNNIQAILQNESSYASQIGQHGQFNCCPYNLRIYTSSNLSHFLLIAQPEPSLFSWIIPKSLIVVDSQAMELRMLKDVRSLNRLLAIPDPLDGPNSKDISALVKTGILIRLAALAHESGRQDFAPPKNLGLIKPGAENYLYNAPRYHRLGLNLMQKVSALATGKSSSHEVALIKQEIENFTALHQMVFYAPQGKSSALLFRKELMVFVPTENYLFGYLTFNNTGTAYQALLLKEGDELQKNEYPQEQIAMQDDIEIKSEIAANVDTNHPIYIQLKAMTAERAKILKPYADAIVEQINHEIKTPSPSFQSDFQNLSHEFVTADAKYNRQLQDSLEALYIQYEEMPTSEFVAFADELNLSQLIQAEEDDLKIPDDHLREHFEQTIILMENSKSLDELDNLIHMATTQLNFDHIRDSKDLIQFQHRLRNQVLIQLDKHILTDKASTLTPAFKEILLHILDQERLIHPEEKEYFLQEFEERMKAKG